MSKLASTVITNGFNFLANGIIQQNHRSSALCNHHDEGLKKSLQLHILQPVDRYAVTSRNMRRLLKEICQYATKEKISILEGLWREVISEQVIEMCTVSTSYSTTTTTTTTTTATHRHQLQSTHRGGGGGYSSQMVNEIRLDQLVDQLLKFLAEVRTISRMDMSITKQCCMSADLAFVTAFQRLSKEKSLDITKALTVRISSLIDAFKPHASSSNTWMQSVDEIADFIQVLFNQTSAEFQHFYELLLARRLLKNRYISLPTERRILAILPAMSKSSTMIRDMEQTKGNMELFRNYIVSRMDFMDLEIDENLAKLILSRDDLTINILTSNVWSAFWVSPLLYARLKLPKALEIIKSEFIRHFDLQDTTRFDNSSNSMKLSEKYSMSYQISGSEENKSRINGLFEPTDETTDGWPIYEMRDNSSSIAEYSARSTSWQIKKKADKGKNAGWAYCKASSKTSLDHVETPWFVWKKSIRSWVIQPIKVVACINSKVDGGMRGGGGGGGDAAAVTTLFNSRKSVSSRSALKRLIWCHAVGTITMKAYLNRGLSCYLLTTEAQAAVLFAFNTAFPIDDNDVDDVSIISNNNNNNYNNKSNNNIGGVLTAHHNIILSFSQLKVYLDLTQDELLSVLATLISSDMPILDRITAKQQQQ